MKPVHSVIFLPILVNLLFVSSVFGSDWVVYWSYNYGNVYSYDRVSIKHRTKNIVQVFGKMDYSYESKEREIQRRINDGVSTKGYDKLSHNVSLIEIDCKKRKVNYLLGIEYDTDGNILSKFSSERTKWFEIVPDTVMDTLREKVCK